MRIALAVALLASAALAQPPPPTTPVQPPGPPAAAPGFATIEQIFARPGDHSAVGLGVYLVNVPIVAKAGRGFWIASPAGRRIFVVPIDPSQLEVLRVGARVDIRGDLRYPLAARQAALELGVGMNDARRIAASPHYIDAWSLTEMR